MMLRSGQKYAPMAVQKPTPFHTNLRYEELISKAIKLDKRLGNHNDKMFHCIQQGKLQESTGAWSPFHPTEDDSDYSDISNVDSIPDLEDDGDVSNDSDDNDSDEPSHPHLPAAQPSGVTGIGTEAAAQKRDWTGVPKTHRSNFASHPMPTTITIDDVNAAVEYKVTRGAYTVRCLDSLQDVPWEREELDELGFRHFAWCGQIAYVILDNKDRIIAVLVPPPAEELFENERIAAGSSFSDKQTSHRRGNFMALAMCVSYGGGQKKLRPLRQARKTHSTLLSTLTSDKDVQRIANFQSDVLASYFLKVYAHVYDSMATLSQSQPELHRNFPGSIYPMTTFNLGPATACHDHNGCNNAPDVPCAITALGDFNPNKGGELIFFDLALVVCFPPGTTILLFSASIWHGNMPT
ncbi:hypothetical protein EWM64_g8086 [Hericium alpestre]|uniref:Uncharacterized protein n=1 Tax=Hericium alpestre TaxID=135208 RepID=A0A4Y9ZNT8_9AGAM|nr:hypothetical protein EWM64_g8086 [Hericium alpestre]